MATANASYYRLLEDPDGSAGPLPSVEVLSNITGTQAVYYINGLLFNKINASYSLQACNNSGCSASSLTVTPDLTQAIAYIKASNTNAGDRFGSAVAMSADGSTLAVGAQGEASAAGLAETDNSAPNAGAVYIFTRTSTGWQQQALLKAPHAAADDYFGKVLSLSLSADGSTLAVGADGEDSNRTGTFAVMPADNNLAPDSGAVYVFARSGSAWGLQSFIKASNAEEYDLFGFAVALSSDGNTLAVGAWGESSGGTGVAADPNAVNDAYLNGAAYVFTRSATLWSQQAYIKPTARGANGIDHQWFGISVALSADGNALAVGSLGDRSNSAADPADSSLDQAGSVHTYLRSAGSWSFQSYLKAHNPQNFDTFGVSVSFSNDGQTLAVGMSGDDSNHTGSFAIAPADNDLLTNSGAVYVYTRSGAGWALQAYLKSSHPDSIDRFGRRAVLSGDGNSLAVSAHRESGSGIGWQGNPTDNAALDSGAVYLFGRSGTSWTQQRYIKASNTRAGSNFGIGLALSRDGQSLAIGADNESSASTGVSGNASDASASGAGAVYLF